MSVFALENGLVDRRYDGVSAEHAYVPLGELVHGRVLGRVEKVLGLQYEEDPMRHPGPGHEYLGKTLVCVVLRIVGPAWKPRHAHSPSRSPIA